MTRNSRKMRGTSKAVKACLDSAETTQAPEPLVCLDHTAFEACANIIQPLHLFYGPSRISEALSLALKMAFSYLLIEILMSERYMV